MPDPVGVEDARQLMTKALTRLLLGKIQVNGRNLQGYAFFAHVAMQMRMVPDESCRIGYTDGLTINYNPEYVQSLSNELRVAFLARFVMHKAFGHNWRRNHRNKDAWALACAFVVSDLLKTSGLPLDEENWSYDPRFEGMSAEEAFRHIDVQEAKVQGNSQGSPEWVRDADRSEMSEEENTLKVQEVAQRASAQGNMPAGLERLVTRTNQPACRDLVSELMAFVSSCGTDDYTYSKAARKGRQQGIINPSLYSLQSPPVVACIDTSGSVTPDLLETYCGALQQVLDTCKPEYLTAISCDAKVHKVAQFFPGDDVVGPFPGNGGTDFRPAFREAMKHEPTCIIYLTDLMGTFPEGKDIPNVPTLWCVYDPHCHRIDVPFGNVIWLE